MQSVQYSAGGVQSPKNVRCILTTWLLPYFYAALWWFLLFNFVLTSCTLLRLLLLWFLTPCGWAVRRLSLGLSLASQRLKSKQAIRMVAYGLNSYQFVLLLLLSEVMEGPALARLIDELAKDDVAEIPAPPPLPDVRQALHRLRSCRRGECPQPVAAGNA